MSAALDHLEASLSEAAKALTFLKKLKSRQVRNAEDRTFLKSTALAWLKNHRQHLSEEEHPPLDVVYHKILDATERMAARSTYIDAFLEAKDALMAVRRNVMLAVPRPPGTSAAPPDFSNLTSDAAMREILTRRWQEIASCISAGAHMSATVMMGGLLESLLLARINIETEKKKIYGATTTPRDKERKPLPLSQWKLLDMVNVGHENGWITKSAKDVGNVLREFRNYIHPHKEHVDNVRITSEDVSIFWEISKSISRQVIASAHSV